ncbi:hypothetical protein H310_10314 [Aphanomyces invadans]|uniref:Uncharacterized protein n=1 Tax=Aphanomyces invadans TaxID=157072 RepID=A0A024TRG1_9STRA|nr:hypothetical protein H310_10314 [Aphanomyces invadans]ETV96618.1 hypothetical protein H310_10314 [Aphanomyces invadans]|eukprot:XP_008874881.1 hypothetical protein H310_10314 [Aphanomyces invadans]
MTEKVNVQSETTRRPRGEDIAAMFIWIKYGFEEIPPKMFNSNVTCDILLGFVRASFLKDVDDLCKQRSVKLSIDIEGVKKHRETAEVDAGASNGEPVSASTQDLADLQLKLETQLEALLSISKTIKELPTSNCLDVVDETGQRLKLNDKARDRAMDFVKPRQVYQLVKVGDTPDAPPTPLKFVLPTTLPTPA